MLSVRSWLRRLSERLSLFTAPQPPRKRRDRAPRRRPPLRLEQLEPYVLLASFGGGPDIWTGVGDWNNNPANWSQGVPSSSSQNVEINGTVTLSVSPSQPIHNLTVDSGASLTITSASTLQVQGSGGITDNGTIKIGGADYGVLEFTGNQTLGGTGYVDFGALADNTIQSDGVLTIGPDITIQGQSGYIGYDTNVATPSSSSFINQGTISANVAGTFGDAIILQTITPWTNDGVVEAANGGDLIAPSLSTNYSAGTLTGGSWNVLSNSTMELDGQSITTNAANILVDGDRSSLNSDSSGDSALASLSANASGGNLTIQNRYTITTSASTLTNTGAVTIASGHY